MKVPVNPQTNVPTGQLGYERAVDVSAGTRMLAQVVDKYAQQAEQDQKKRELFDVQKAVVDEVNNIQTDFDKKTQVQPLGAPNFTQQVAGEYNTRHNQIIKDFKDRGYSDDAINELATRLGTIRSQYVAKAIDFQEKSNLIKADSDSDGLFTSLSQYASTHPEAVQSALDEGREGLRHLGLTEPEQELMYERKKGAILQGAREGFAVQHPEVVLGLYGFPTELTTTSPTNLPAGQQFDLPVYMNKLGPAEGTAKNPRSSAKGFGQFLDSTWIGTYKEVFGQTKETNAQILAKKTDKGIATKLTEKLTSNNVQGLVAANAPVNDATVYLAHFLGLQDALDVIKAHADATIKGLVNSKSIAANPTVFKKIQTAGDLIAWAQEKMNVEPQHLAALKPIPPNWKGNQEDAIQELGMTAEQADIFLKTGQDTRGLAATAPTVGTPTLAQAAGVTLDAEGKTGIPVLDLSSGPDRIQMLTIARTIMNQRENDAKAAQKQAHDTWLNDFYNKLYDGKYGQADLNAAYQNGQITDFSERQRAQGILDEKNKVNKDLQRFDLMLASGQKFNPFDNDAQKAVDAGFDRAIKYSIDHPDVASAPPLQIGLRAWQRTGILPSQVGVMLRGGLVSTDPKQVEAAAAVATNMIRENPNAFVSQPGQAEIEHAATAFGHYVYDKGMSPTEAANQIAIENDPKFKEKAKYNDPMKLDALKSLRQNGVNASQAFDGAKFPNVETQGEANQTYYELITDQLTRGADLSMAMAQAKAQMQKIYGVNSNGNVIKYPPEKAYPPLNGSWRYVYDDALKTVKTETGRDPTGFNLVPIPGVTDQDFRTGAPARYRLLYSYKTKDGQTVIDSVPGQFAADVNAARQEITQQAGKAFGEARKRAIEHGPPVFFPGIGEVR